MSKATEEGRFIYVERQIFDINYFTFCSIHFVFFIKYGRLTFSIFIYVEICTFIVYSKARFERDLIQSKTRL